MFNTHVSIKTPDKVVHQRAPTDESMRIVQEMEQKVIDRVVGSIHVNDNTLNFKLQLLANLPYQTVDAHYSLTLNGVELKDKVSLPQWEAVGPGGAQALVHAVLSHVADRIKGYLTESVLETAIKSMRYRG